MAVMNVHAYRPLDREAMAARLATYGVVGRLAPADPRVEDGPAHLHPAPGDTEDLAEVLYALDAVPVDQRRPGAGAPGWSPWPATADRLVGTYVTVLGPLEVHAPVAQDHQ